MNIAGKIKMDFENVIDAAIKDYLRNADEPAGLFSCNRKLDRTTMVKALRPMYGINFNTSFNKDAPSFMTAPNTVKGDYNQYKATVMVDQLSNQTAGCTPAHKQAK